MSDLRLQSLTVSLRYASLHRAASPTAWELVPKGVAVEPYEKLEEIPFFDQAVEGEQRTRTGHPEYTLSGGTWKGNLK